MVMKHYRHFETDAECRQLLHLLSGRERKNSYKSVRHREKAEYRIRNNSLFLRKRIDILGTCVSIRTHRQTFLICPHIALVKKCRSVILRLRLGDPDDLGFAAEYDGEWAMHLRCGSGQRAMESEVRRCRCCETEFLVGFEETSTCEVKLTVVIWKELGRGIGARPLRQFSPVPDEFCEKEEFEVDWEEEWGDVSWESDSLGLSVKGVGIVEGELAAKFERAWPGGSQDAQCGFLESL